MTGLNAPKGMALKGDRLFVADIDRLVEIDGSQAPEMVSDAIFSILRDHFGEQSST